MTIDVGLCRRCVYLREVPNRRGSVFYLCKLSAEDASFMKYPPLPVLECSGFKAKPSDDERNE